MKTINQKEMQKSQMIPATDLEGITEFIIAQIVKIFPDREADPKYSRQMIQVEHIAQDNTRCLGGSGMSLSPNQLDELKRRYCVKTNDELIGKTIIATYGRWGGMSLGYIVPGYVPRN